MSAAAKAATAKPEALGAADADCRAVLAEAIKERDEAGQRADALLEQLAEARTAFDTKEAAYLRKKEANQNSIGLPDAAVLAAFREEQELGSLADAAKRLFDQTNAKLDNARRHVDEAERAVRQAIGVLLATEGVTRASRFLDGWAKLIDEAAALLALRAACEKLRTPIPYEFAGFVQHEANRSCLKRPAICGGVPNGARQSHGHRRAAFQRRRGADHLKESNMQMVKISLDGVTTQMNGPNWEPSVWLGGKCIVQEVSDTILIPPGEVFEVDLKEARRLLKLFGGTIHTEPPPPELVEAIKAHDEELARRCPPYIPRPDDPPPRVGPVSEVHHGPAAS